MAPNFRVEIVPPKHVYLLSERASHALTGRLYCDIVPFLDGRHTRGDIYQALSGRVLADHVDHVIQRLRDRGFLHDDPAHGLTPGAAAFWSELGVAPAEAERRLARTRVSLTPIGETDIAGLHAELAAIGIGVARRHANPAPAGDIALDIVLTDDYLRPELAAINRAALDAGRPWFLAKPDGSVIWLGPVFVPGETGCWQCLAHRLNGNAEIKASIVRQRRIAAGDTEPAAIAQPDPPACLPTARPALAATGRLAAAWITMEIAKWLVTRAAISGDAGFNTLSARMLSVDLITLETHSHSLPHRPQCPACGDPDRLRARASEPIVLRSCRKTVTADGGHRTTTPERTLERYRHLISPITGVVTELERISDADNPLVHTYRASHSLGGAGSLRGLRRVLRHKSSGKGKTDAQSRVGGLCEAIERYSFIHQGDEPRQRATLADLGERAIHPARVLHFSDAQIADRDALNAAAGAGHHDWIPERFQPDRPIDWTPLWSLTQGTRTWLPTAYCYIRYPLEADHAFCVADSNGNAAGNTLEEAIVQGFLEVVERDAVALWWYNAVRRPAVDLASFNDPYFADLERLYRDRGRDLWVLDLTADLDIPTVVAVSRRVDGGSERLICGNGAHLDPAVAITRALTEMSQVGLELDKIPDDGIDDESADWLLRATLETKPYLVPDPTVPARVAGDFPSRWSDDLRDDIRAMVAVAERAGLEVLVLDLTRPDIGLPVVKVAVPGMRHFWSRFAPGRLYDVPVALGWLTAPLTEDRLNRTPMPF